MSFINKKLLLITFFSLLHISSQKQEDSAISLFFKKDSILTSIEDTVTMRNLQFNKIYINSKIATPNQDLKLYLKFSEYIIYITDKGYKKEESTSYEFMRKTNNKEKAEFTPLDLQTDNLKSGYESKEILKLDEDVIQNFNFILVDKLNYNYDIFESIIGLNLPEKDIRPLLLNTNIFEQLKKNNSINKRMISIFYFNNLRIDKKKNDYKKCDGQIIFGKLPHEFKDENKISEIKKRYNIDQNNLYWANIIAEDYHKKWKIKFDSIEFSNTKLEDLIVEFIIEQNFFTGTSNFKTMVHKNFFEKYISKKLCKEEKFFNYKENFEYYYYICENSLKCDLDKNNDTILAFKNQDLNEIFNFRLKELFFEYNNRMYFGVIFDQYQMHGWKLGRIFFEKYPLIFSLDNKAIGYYKQNVEIKNNKNRKITMTLILIILVIFLLLLLFIILRKYNALKSLIPRKLKANELNDQYSYSSYSQIGDKKKEITTEMASTMPKNSISSLGY